VSARDDAGIEELVKTVYDVYEALTSRGCLEDKRKERVRKHVTAVFSRKVHEVLDSHFELSKNIDSWINKIYSKEVRPYEFINEKIETFLKECEEDD
jgi:putative protein kinase ArgK-like GTPase of G3E family